MNRGALLLIGVPLAGALLAWLAISIFSSNPTTPPAAVIEQPARQPAVETQPAIETPPATESNAVSSAEPEPEPVDPEPVDAEPLQQPDAPPSAINEVIPNVPQSALDTITGTVRLSVRVIIDNDGAVVDAAADDPGPSRYFEAALHRCVEEVDLHVRKFGRAANDVGEVQLYARGYGSGESGRRARLNLDRVMIRGSLELTVRNGRFTSVLKMPHP